MNNGKITSTQLYTWLIVAMSAPLAVAASGSGWLANLLAGVVCTLICVCVLGIVRSKALPKWFLAVESLWLIPVLIALTSKTGNMWPDAGSGKLIPVVLLVLGAWSASGDLRRGIGAGVTLIWIIAVMYGFVCTAAVKDIQVKWLIPPNMDFDLELMFIYLLPLVVILLPCERKNAWGIWLIPSLGVLFSVLTSGVLSAGLASELENPFYEMSKSLSLFGVARRFEALVASVVTLGWFGLISMILHAISNLGKGAVWGAAIAAGVAILCELTIATDILAVGSVLFWVILPVATQGIGKIKKI